MYKNLTVLNVRLAQFYWLKTSYRRAGWERARPLIVMAAEMRAAAAQSARVALVAKYDCLFVM